jgi:hypothetical protein
MRKIILSAISAVILVFGFAGVASAESTKTCSEEFKQGWDATNTQTAQCGSESDNKHETPQTRTNPGGNVPPGAQP